MLVAPPVVPVVSLLTRILLCLLVVPVRVSVRGCAHVLPLKPCEGPCCSHSARPLARACYSPCLFVPARSLRLVAVRLCPACEWNDGVRGSCCATISAFLSPFKLSKSAQKSQSSRAPWHSLLGRRSWVRKLGFCNCVCSLCDNSSGGADSGNSGIAF